MKFYLLQSFPQSNYPGWNKFVCHAPQVAPSDINGAWVKSSAATAVAAQARRCTPHKTAALTQHTSTLQRLSRCCGWQRQPIANAPCATPTWAQLLTLLKVHFESQPHTAFPDNELCLRLQLWVTCRNPRTSRYYSHRTCSPRGPSSSSH